MLYGMLLHRPKGARDGSPPHSFVPTVRPTDVLARRWRHRDGPSSSFTVAARLRRRQRWRHRRTWRFRSRSIRARRGGCRTTSSRSSVRSNPSTCRSPARSRREFNGVYVRNGSNPQSGDSTHWFMGDGMLHGVRLEKGAAPSRIATATSARRCSPPERTIATASSRSAATTRATSAPSTTPDVCSPRARSASRTRSIRTILSTVGVYDFDGALNTSFTAHPKIDPATGYLHFFGYGIVPPFLTYFVADETGVVIHSEVIAVERTTMIHSFAITEQRRDLLGAAGGASTSARPRPASGPSTGTRASARASASCRSAVRRARSAGWRSSRATSSTS